MKLYQILSHDLARFFRLKGRITPLGRITRREVPGSVASVYVALAINYRKESSPWNLQSSSGSEKRSNSSVP